jgi:hypothetical protein
MCVHVREWGGNFCVAGCLDLESRITNHEALVFSYRSCLSSVITSDLGVAGEEGQSSDVAFGFGPGYWHSLILRLPSARIFSVEGSFHKRCRILRNASNRDEKSPSPSRCWKWNYPQISSKILSTRTAVIVPRISCNGKLRLTTYNLQFYMCMCIILILAKSVLIYKCVRVRRTMPQCSSGSEPSIGPIF